MLPTCRLLLLSALSVMVSRQGRAQNCTLICPENRVVSADSGQGGALVTFELPEAQGNCGQVTYRPQSGSFFRIGATTVIAQNTTGQRCSFTVTVTDNESPALSPITLSPKKLWPADKEMKEVEVHYDCSDNSGETHCSLSVTSNAPQAGGWEVMSDHLVRLWAKRLPNGRARIYTITVTCTDPSGNVSRHSTGIAVSSNILAQ